MNEPINFVAMKKIYIVILLAILSIGTYGQTFWIKHSGNPVLTNGTRQDWDWKLQRIGSVVFLDSIYHMWYNATDDPDVLRVGHATSPDGYSWTKDPDNPVFAQGSEGSWDQSLAVCGAVILVKDTLHMWYTGHNGSWSNSGIGHATSTDGVNWTRDPINPVLPLEPEGNWGMEWFRINEVVYDGTTYHMWYEGGKLTYENHGIGHATSINGSTWTRDLQNPVLTPGTPADWDNPIAGTPGVVFDGSLFHMWYAGGGYTSGSHSEIGYAFSTDGSDWTKYDENPVIKVSSGSWDGSALDACNVIDSAGIKYKMWYRGRLWGVSREYGYAESDTRVPYLSIVDGNPVYDSRDTIVAEIVLDGTIYIVPEGTSPVVDSILKFMVASVEALANTETEIPLTDISVGKYLIFGVSSTGFVSSNPYLLNVVDNAEKPKIILEANNVAQGEPIVAESDKEGIIYLLSAPIEPDLSDPSFPFFFKDSSHVKASVRVEFPTDGLNITDYWLFAVDIYGLISEPDSVTIIEATGIDASENSVIRIYPNPTNTYISVETGNIGHCTIELNSINGQLLYSGRMEGTTHQINLSCFRKGIYFITIKSADFVTTRKVIKFQ